MSGGWRQGGSIRSKLETQSTAETAAGNAGSIPPENSEFSRKAKKNEIFLKKCEILSFKILVINVNLSTPQNTPARPAGPVRREERPLAREEER